MNIIGAPEFIEQIQNANEKFYILDVRSEAEYKKARLAGIASDNVPLHEVPDVVDTIVNHCRNMPTYVLCKAGKRAQFAAMDIEAAGAENVIVVDGGTLALDALGIPFTSGVISIERQYLVIIGGLTTLGLVFDLDILILLAAAALLARGITGKCGLIKIIAKMPWNAYLQQDIQEEISKSVQAYQDKKAGT